MSLGKNLFWLVHHSASKIGTSPLRLTLTFGQGSIRGSNLILTGSKYLPVRQAGSPHPAICRIVASFHPKFLKSGALRPSFNRNDIEVRQA
jgi:hypothetical protein